MAILIEIMVIELKDRASKGRCSFPPPVDFFDKSVFEKLNPIGSTFVVSHTAIIAFVAGFSCRILIVSREGSVFTPFGCIVQLKA